MSDRLQRSPCLALLVLGLLTSTGVMAQGVPPLRGDTDPAPTSSNREYRPSDDPDQAAHAARKATGGRVLGVQGAERDGQPGYRVRILQPDGRVRNFHYDPGSGKMRD